MKETKYWKSIADLSEDRSPKEEKEFAEDLPVLSSVTESISLNPTGRRDFLKMLGFSLSAAAFAASCEMPVRKSIPYVFRPEEVVPGVANYYASTFYSDGDFVSVLVKTREGRPIKIEGNSLSQISQGGTSARAQASVLGLYYGGRLQAPTLDGKSVSWEELDKSVTSQIQSITEGGGKVAILTSSIISPSAKSIIGNLTASGKVTQVVLDGISYHGVLSANEKNFGKRAIPNYRFDEADLIVSIAADFLGTWVSPVEYAADYSKNRKVDKANPKMSRHIQIEAIPSLTGSNADERVPVKPSEELLAAISLYNSIASKAGAAPAGEGMKSDKITAIAEELWAARGKSIVVSGINNVAVQELVNATNQLLGNYGTTIKWDRPNYTRQGNDDQFAQLIADINSGAVKGLIIANANPIYTAVQSAQLAEALKKLSLSVFVGEKRNETSDLCKIIAPANHYLESWDDAEAKHGIFTTTQPTINRLYNTRQWQESFMRWAGISGTYEDYIKNYWTSNIASTQSKFADAEALWANTLHDGEIVSNTTTDASFTASDVAMAGAAIRTATAKRGGLELKLFENVALGSGNMADNPWLQELPDPITKVTWDNCIVIGDKNSELVQNEDLKNYKEFHVAELKIGNQTLTLPVYYLPGVPAGVIGVAYGYGRTVTNHEEFTRGVNVHQLNPADCWSVSINGTGAKMKLGCTQTHHELTMQTLAGEKTRHIIKETTLDEYKKDAWSGNTIGDGVTESRRDEWMEHHMVTLYGEHEYNGHHWNMVIDLNACTGCSACVVSCIAENNIPVVGKDEIWRSREMHWLRIDKYYTGDVENPQVTFQPMLCQHCDNAPCENVCPVAATNHSAEGLNQMAYNRCIGTRYCANNCPYKVRRFNWFDYMNADSFNTKTTFVNNYDDTLGLQEPLSRMVLNPDVTVRSRGVIEKCSFCVQRIQDGKLTAKKANRPLEDGDIVTACQSACPTNAISFGDGNDKSTQVAELMSNERAFGVIEEIHTLPSVMYLTKIRNTKA